MVLFYLACVKEHNFRVEKKKLGRPSCAPGVLTRPTEPLAFDIRSYVKSESKVSQKLKISYGQKGAPWALKGGPWEWSK